MVLDLIKEILKDCQYYMDEYSCSTLGEVFKDGFIEFEWILMWGIIPAVY